MAVLFLLASANRPVVAQTAPPSAAPSAIETEQDFVARLTPEQKQQFDEAVKDYKGHQDLQAQVLFTQLRKDFPADAYLAKLASEPALNLGGNQFAVSVLKPVADANPDDWQAVSLLARAYAQSGDKAARDAAIARMLDLHKRGLTPEGFNQYIVERVSLDNGTVVIYTSIEPWSQYKVQNMGKIFQADGKLILTTTIESADFDQPGFAKQYPKEAAAGLRRFSLDGYKDTGVNSQNQKTSTHYTFKFFVGQPSYDTVRQEFLDIATGKTKPVSSRDNLISN